MNSRLRLILTGALLFAYVILITYFLVTYSPENGEITTDWSPTDSLYEDSGDNAPELLAEFMNAYQRGDYDSARQYADSLNTKYPGSLYAKRAEDILAGLESDASDKTVAQNTPSASKSSDIKKTTARSTKFRSSRSKSSTPKVNKEQLAKENRERLEKAFERLRTVNDNRQQITWHYNKNVSHYVYKNSLEAYIGKNDEGDVWLRMRIYYTGEKPLNIESYEIHVAEKDYPISILYGSMERGKGPRGSWEWYDAQVSSKDLEMLRKVAEVGQTEIRYIGKSGTFRRMMTEPEKLRISYIVDAYNALMAQKQLLSSHTRSTQARF